MINKYTDPIITNYRFDKVGSRASVPITESLTVNNGFLFLKEIPDKNNVVTIGNLVEVQKPEELDSETKFYIDYNAGIVYFDSKLNGTKVNVEYSGIGIVYYPASRIYLEVDENHEIIRTLSDIEGQLSSLTDLKNQQERLKREIEERNGDLNNTIKEAKSINLDGSVDKAKQAKTELESTTSKANTAKIDLDTQIDTANKTKAELKNQENNSTQEIQKSVDLAKNTKTSLDDSITTANKRINEADQKSKEVASKINEANETQQKLTNTKNDITSSLSDYEKKSAEIKSSSSDLESKNNELRSTISRADESNATLNSTIEKSKESNTTLSGTVEESKAKNEELSSSITTATDLKGELETKSKEASGNIASLNSKISEGNQLKSDLDTSTTNANQANTELKDTTSKANLSKTQLDESKASADELNKNLLNNKNELTTLDNSLKAENEKATKNISDLKTESESAKKLKNSLSEERLESQVERATLRNSIRQANSLNDSLKSNRELANETKTSLEQLKNESSTLSNELSEKNTTASSNIESLKSENQNAKTNITGLQTENQNALSKQQTLSSETTKANEAITKITELIASSTDLKNKLEQIVASGDLDKYITDPKLREILTTYATKDDLSKIDVASQLENVVKHNFGNDTPPNVDYITDKGVYFGKFNLGESKLWEGGKPYFGSYESGVLIVYNSSGETNAQVFTSLASGKTWGRLGWRDTWDRGWNRIDKASAPISEDELKKMKFKFTDLNSNSEIYAPLQNVTEFTGKWLLEHKNEIESLSNKKADKSSIPTSLSQLKDDETHRLVTDEEKNRWNSGLGVDLSDYATKEDLGKKAGTNDIEYLKDKINGNRKDIEHVYDNLTKNINSKADKSSIPTLLSQLTNDTKFKTETEIQEMIANSSKLKKEVATSLPSSGKDDVIYLVKDTNGKDNNNYLEYLWIDGKWEMIGSTQVDLSGYATTEEFDESNEFIRMEIKEAKAELKATIDHESSRFESFKASLSPFTQQELEEAFK